MIHSLFIINTSGYVLWIFWILKCSGKSLWELLTLTFSFRRDVFMEKHWKSVISRSVCDYFFEEQKKISSPIDMPPVLATPHHYLITIFRCNMYFVAVCTTEGNLKKETNYSG